MNRLFRFARAGLLAVLFAAHVGGAALAQTGAACPPAAPTPTPEQLQAGLRNARDHGFLWRISKDGRSSWLYGTLHVAKFDWTFPGPKVNAALRASDTIALEMDLLDPEVQRLTAAAMAAQAQAHAPLPAALQRRLERAARAECIAPQALAALAPDMQIAALTTLMGRRDGLHPSYGIDLFLAGWGRSEKRRVVSLESPELQLQALRSATPAETTRSVAAALDEIESGRARPLLRRLAQLWADGDWATLSAYESWCDCLKTSAERADLKRLLDDRNPGLADAIAALHASGQQVFAAVGSLHMIGPTGLPALLARRGYRIDPIAYDPPPQENPP